jgi:hypothetical protein
VIKLSENLYNKLPPLYKSEDSKIEPIPFPLKRFLQVLGGGFDFLESKIIDFGNIIDVDNCPNEYVNLLAHLLGIDFPYSMDVATKKKFIKVFPTLNKLKGSPSSFEYLARETFGSTAVISTNKTQYVEGMPSEEWRKIHVRVELDGESLYLSDKEESFKKFAETLRPANSILVTDLALFYMDKFNKRANVEYTTDIFYDTLLESYLKASLADVLTYEKLTSSDADSYLASKIEEFIEFITTSDTELLNKGKDDLETSHIFMTNIPEEIYTRNTVSEGTTKFITVQNGISNLTGITNLTTSFKTTNYAPLNYTISH